jgi:hypothetical protein
MGLSRLPNENIHEKASFSQEYWLEVSPKQNFESTNETLLGCAIFVKGWPTAVAQGIRQHGLQTVLPYSIVRAIERSFWKCSGSTLNITIRNTIGLLMKLAIRRRKGSAMISILRDASMLGLSTHTVGCLILANHSYRTSYRF